MSFDLHHLLLVFTAYIVGAASPGPSNMRIMGVAMHRLEHHYFFCSYAIVFSTAPMIRGYRRARRWIEGTLALVFGAAGLKLLFSRT
ncbi:hypothetical protein PMI30_00864 [Pseudomonas sp. GM50]|jgi:threonine/homoserine/homoserine lactone efflux protein|uniref:hypothetical protein n=1 Tax=Pseudomonas sp. GM50 TaxID=1144332 RepID=UPI0002706014|nr:hypothetical protein [Pseudomonas sp. GM50]EJM70079.1 hypothetical protein PMI30_00864 [Pseudomonas sp. GM50]